MIRDPLGGGWKGFDGNCTPNVTHIQWYEYREINIIGGSLLQLWNTQTPQWRPTDTFTVVVYEKSNNLLYSNK